MCVLRYWSGKDLDTHPHIAQLHIDFATLPRKSHISGGKVSDIHIFATHLFITHLSHKSLWIRSRYRCKLHMLIKARCKSMRNKPCSLLADEYPCQLIAQMLKNSMLSCYNVACASIPLEQVSCQMLKCNVDISIRSEFHNSQHTLLSALFSLQLYVHMHPTFKNQPFALVYRAVVFILYVKSLDCIVFQKLNTRILFPQKRELPTNNSLSTSFIKSLKHTLRKYVAKKKNTTSQLQKHLIFPNSQNEKLSEIFKILRSQNCPQPRQISIPT